MINPAYLAGIIDSDGSISIARRNINRQNPSYCVMFQLTWKLTEESKQFMSDLTKQYGGSFSEVNSSSAGRFKNPSRIIKCCITDNNVEQLLIDTLPFLILKKKQAIRGLRVREVIREKPEDKFEILNKLYDENRFLNHKLGKGGK